MSNHASTPVQPQPAQPGHPTSITNSEIIRELMAERDRLRAELEAARAEQAKTAAELAEITEERNTYHREVMELMRDDSVTITKEELEEVRKKGVSLHETFREIEAKLVGKE